MPLAVESPTRVFCAIIGWLQQRICPLGVDLVKSERQIESAE